MVSFLDRPPQNPTAVHHTLSEMVAAFHNPRPDYKDARAQGVLLAQRIAAERDAEAKAQKKAGLPIKAKAKPASTPSRSSSAAAASASGSASVSGSAFASGSAGSGCASTLASMEEDELMVEEADEAEVALALSGSGASGAAPTPSPVQLGWVSAHAVWMAEREFHTLHQIQTIHKFKFVPFVVAADLSSTAFTQIVAPADCMPNPSPSSSLLRVFAVCHGCTDGLFC